MKRRAKQFIQISLIALILWIIFPVIYKQNTMENIVVKTLKIVMATTSSKERICDNQFGTKRESSNYITEVNLIHVQKNYSIISAALPNFTNDTVYIDPKKGPIVVPKSWTYIFQLPLASLFWSRLGHIVIVIVTVDYKHVSPSALRLMTYVENVLESLNTIVVYFDVPSYMKVRLSQCLRLAVAHLPFLRDDDFLFTDDADMWPFQIDRYVVPIGKSIYVANAMMRNKQFGHNNRFGVNQTYQEYPMSTIGMSNRIWKSVFGKLIDGLPDSNNTYRLDSLKPLIKRLKNFSNNKDIYTSDHNGVGWQLDQRFASYTIEEWLFDNGHNHIAYQVHPPKCRRVHRSWDEYKKLVNKGCVDTAHIVLKTPWRKGDWDQILPLIMHFFSNSTFGDISDVKTFLNEYRGYFVTLKNKK